MGKNELCIAYLQKIIKSKNLGSAEDLQCFARVLNLIAHYECGLDYDLERQFVDTYKFLLKMENLQEVQKVFLTSIRDLSDVFPHEIKNEFKKIHTKLKKYEEHPYEKRVSSHWHSDQSAAAERNPPGPQQAVYHRRHAERASDRVAAV